jgi:hypothetical protein
MSNVRFGFLHTYGHIRYFSIVDCDNRAVLFGFARLAPWVLLELNIVVAAM